MSIGQQQRPSFFEGQYLSATDLELAVEYNRFQQARHALGAHTWGIGSGLQLKELPAAGSGVEVVLQPGFAIDGFGRQIVVRNPHKLSAEIFETITGPTNVVRVQVWIRFRADNTNSPNDLFKVCDAEDQFARLQEGYEIVAAREATLDHAEQHDNLDIDGQSVEALAAPPSRAKTDPVICDESVPYQTFPSTEQDPDRSWLVPLGYVRWNIAARQLDATQPAEQRLSRRFRRYIGSVAEEIQAADGLIRLRHRETDPPADETTPLDAACTASLLSPDEDVDLAIDTDSGRLQPIDLVWIEGHLRLLGDGKVVGGRIDFRETPAITDHLSVRRAPQPNPQNGKDLQLVIGNAEDGQNRLAVGPLAAGTDDLVPRLVVLDSGQVGIQTDDPECNLQIGDTSQSVSVCLRGPQGEEVSSYMAFQSTGGEAGNWFKQVYDTSNDLLLFLSSQQESILSMLADNGNVGIGTLEPNNALTILRSGSAHLNIKANDGDQEIQVGVVSNSGRVRTITNHDLRLGAGASTKMTIKTSGRVGIGTLSPSRNLTIQSEAGTYLNVRGNGAAHEVLLGADDNGGIVSTMTNHDLQLRAGGNDTKMTIKANGRVGIGTNSPASLLDVRGDVRLGPNGVFFAASTPRRSMIIAGRVNSNGNQGGGDVAQFDSTRLVAGLYIVTLVVNPPFAEAPSVVVTPLAENGQNDNVPTVLNITPTQFQVVFRDMLTPNEGDPQDSPFSFIAVGRR